jgi:putative hemolysin
MNWVTIIEAAVLVVLLCCSAFFSGTETTLFSLTPVQIHRIRRHRPKAAQQIEQLLASPRDLLSVLLIGNTLVNVAAADLGFVVAETFLPGRGESVAIPAMTLIIILFGEVTPKRFAVRRAEALAPLCLPPVKLLLWLLAPARVLMELIARGFRRQLQPVQARLTEDELLTAVDVSHEEGVLTKDERAMIDGIIRLESLTASDIMTPRVDLVGIDLNGNPAAYADAARKARFPFLPVYRGSTDQVEGFLDTRRFLLDPAHDLKAAMFPHYFVPDTSPLDTLLTTFQQQDRKIAIVIDEYGGTAGLITRGDLLDEIAEFSNVEGGPARVAIEPAGPNRWLVDGSTSLEEINYELDLGLQAEGADRVAGWVIAEARRLPKTGDVIETPQGRVTVLQMRKHRVTTVLIEKGLPEGEVVT